MIGSYYIISTPKVTLLHFCHLANILTNTDDMLKVNFYHLTSILTNTDDEADDCIKESVIT